MDAAAHLTYMDSGEEARHEIEELIARGAELCEQINRTLSAANLLHTSLSREIHNAPDGKPVGAQLPSVELSILDRWQLSLEQE